MILAWQHETNFVSVPPTAVEFVLTGIRLEDIRAASVEVQPIIGSEPAGMCPFFRLHIRKIQIIHWLEPTKIWIKFKGVNNVDWVFGI